MMTIYLDMDGVLADFDKAAQKEIGTDNTYKWEWVHGTKAFWDIINRNPSFWSDMEKMPDAHILLDAVLPFKPKVLTALPKKDSSKVVEDKTNWIKKNVGDLEVITCLTHEKPSFATPGDILIDDRAMNEEPWRYNGGQFILHRDAMSTISILKDLGVILA